MSLVLVAMLAVACAPGSAPPRRGLGATDPASGAGTSRSTGTGPSSQAQAKPSGTPKTAGADAPAAWDAGPGDSGAAGASRGDGGQHHSTGPQPVSARRAQWLLFRDRASRQARQCASRPNEQARIACLIGARYAGDARAAKEARGIYADTGSVAGLETAHRMDGGWRGQIDLVAELPVGRHRHHLIWIRGALRDISAWHQAMAAQAARPLRYRVAPLELRFFRSVGRTTPSAYASGWSLAYNVSGSLHRGAAAVRATLFHEIFHLNDAAHGDWSARVLRETYQALVARCTRHGRSSTPCLRPFAPGRTMVRGGTYYAFQPGGGVQEYAAELASRYFDEQRRRLAKQPLGRRPFKCGPPPNAKAWRLLRDEFFAAVDLVPDCP